MDRFDDRHLSDSDIDRIADDLRNGRHFSLGAIDFLSLHEAANYDNGTITNGYGQASGVFVEVQKGTEADIDVDFTLDTISEETYKKWKSEISQYFTEDQKSKLEENLGAFGLAGGYFASAFGLIFGGGDYNHYKNKSGDFHCEGDSNKEGFAKSVYNLETSKFRVQGKLKAKGTSFIPTKVSAYVKVTKFRFTDGKELHVMSTDDTSVANSKGSTEGAQVESHKLNITPL